jgi:hypothetical protein
MYSNNEIGINFDKFKKVVFPHLYQISEDIIDTKSEQEHTDI